MAKKKKKLLKGTKKLGTAKKKAVVAKGSTKKQGSKKVSSKKSTAKKGAKLSAKVKSKTGVTRKVISKTKPLKVKKTKAKSEELVVTEETGAISTPKAKKKPSAVQSKPAKEKGEREQESKKKSSVKPQKESSSSEEVVLAEAEDQETELKPIEEIILTDAEGRRYCRRRDCDQLAMVEGYCRYHYLLYWKRIQQRKKILSDGKLVNYIGELTSRYPDKYLEMIRRDLRTEKDFLAAIQELEIDESGSEDGDFDEDNSILDEVRGMSETHSRDEEDF
ncbi:MAG: hypothetical protein KDD35_04260 [Bdellovibrionales bacterium]|nr:hypothetical protein [Bdellovibrionales bacterium]